MNELQKHDLNILKSIDEFCKEHKINYVLYGGTLLGSIRHKGFIPWDDDVDIMMTRNEFEKFENLFINKSNIKDTYFYQSRKTIKNLATPISRVRDKNFDIENVFLKHKKDMKVLG